MSVVPSALLLPLDPLLFVWYHVLCQFTMFPLLERDGLRIPYFSLLIAFLTICSFLFYDKNQQQFHFDYIWNLWKVYKNMNVSSSNNWYDQARLIWKYIVPTIKLHFIGLSVMGTYVGI